MNEITKERNYINFFPFSRNESWRADWSPESMSVDWGDIDEWSLLYDLFEVEVEIVIGGQDFTPVGRGLFPIVDYVIILSFPLLTLLREGGHVEAISSNGIAFYVFALEGDTVIMTDLDKAMADPERGGSIQVSIDDYRIVKEQAMDKMYSLLYGAHPELRRHKYIAELRESLAEHDKAYVCDNIDSVN
ncbi:hypothetical protein [Natronoglycomyces albus]|uniref:Uncharacterized protein n=1 Tax=Natronoglycomyces albus TaxID=2811108 RepID=A0A895XNX0_9ACTN|nr:hypothetical protein [Natronoglycomyces albus]QSB04196.1 hypothetical protein JQS30_10265 [Natronoglycomyces albus]